jgi:hypothetical protein
MVVVIAGEGGRVLTLDGDLERTFTAELVIESGRAACTVHEHGDLLSPFFADLAESWSGWEGEKVYRSLEADLELRASHDGLGSINLGVIIGRVAPPSWTMAAGLQIDAGEQLASIAKALA